MGATRLRVLNTALALLGEPESQDGDPLNMSVNAKKVWARLDEAKEMVLERHGWAEALKYVSLEPSEVLANWRFGSGYYLPSGALKVWRVELDDCYAWEEGTDWTEGGTVKKIIQTEGSGSLRLSIIMNVPIEALGPNLANAIGYRLAALGCEHVTGAELKADKLLQRAETQMQIARGVDGGRGGGGEVEVPDPALAIRRSV